MLIDEDYTARLTDFGYASLVGNIPEALNYLQRSTVHGGATRWMAPEQTQETFSWTIKSDVYSFGCIALQASWLKMNASVLLIPLQALSGKQPWSEVREDTAVIFRLMTGHKPARPECRTLHDSHWKLIQQCWSSVEERPPTESIISTIRQFINHSSPFQPLRDVAASLSGQSDPLSDESLFPRQSTTPMHEISNNENSAGYVKVILVIHSML